MYRKMYRIYMTFEDAPPRRLEEFDTLEQAERVVEQWLRTDALDRSYAITEVAERPIIYQASLVTFPAGELEAGTLDPFEPLRAFNRPTLAEARRMVQELESVHPGRSYRIDKVIF